MAQKKPMMNYEAMEVLEKTILQPSPTRRGKSHDDLVWEEAQRYILDCIRRNILVQP